MPKPDAWSDIRQKKAYGEDRRGAAAEKRYEQREMPPLTGTPICLCPSRSKLDDAQPPVAQRPDGGFSATLLAMAGHDLRQPLQVLTAAHDVLGSMLQEQREELTRAEAAAKKLVDMLCELVEVVQLETSLDQPRVLVSVARIVHELADEFSELARDTGISFRVIAIRGTAISHPVLLTGMLRNLIRNAIDYTPPGGRVVVVSRRRGSELHIQVRDNGSGIREAALSRIFEAFQRASDTRPGVIHRQAGGGFARTPS